jgi:hypothetical protein
LVERSVESEAGETQAARCDKKILLYNELKTGQLGLPMKNTSGFILDLPA